MSENTGEKEMKALAACIEELRLKLERYKKRSLKELSTRTIFVDPLLQALGWDVRDPDDVELEYPTIDGKSVDYAPKINRKPVLFVEAKSLNDPLTDVKAITQVVGYAANAGVEWCILTNGVAYKVYRSTERAKAPDKLLFEISLAPKDSAGMSTEQVADQFARFSREAMARGLLDEIGEQVFTTGKVRKALDKLFADPPGSVVRIVRLAIGDDTLRPAQIKEALKRLWMQTPQVGLLPYKVDKKPAHKTQTASRAKDYGEDHHLRGCPQEVVELFRSLDRFCRDLSPMTVTKTHRAKSVNYLAGNKIFCCVHLQKNGIRVWLKLKHMDLQSPPPFVRDVSRIGHWGVGDVEAAIDSLLKLEAAKPLIRKSFEQNGGA